MHTTKSLVIATLVIGAFVLLIAVVALSEAYADPRTEVRDCSSLQSVETLKLCEQTVTLGEKETRTVSLKGLAPKLEERGIPFPTAHTLADLIRNGQPLQLAGRLELRGYWQWPPAPTLTRAQYELTWSEKGYGLTSNGYTTKPQLERSERLTIWFLAGLGVLCIFVSGWYSALNSSGFKRYRDVPDVVWGVPVVGVTYIVGWIGSAATNVALKDLLLVAWLLSLCFCMFVMILIIIRTSRSAGRDMPKQPHWMVVGFMADFIPAFLLLSLVLSLNENWLLVMQILVFNSIAFTGVALAGSLCGYFCRQSKHTSSTAA
jgi:hypothetical protein